MRDVGTAPHSGLWSNLENRPKKKETQSPGTRRSLSGGGRRWRRSLCSASRRSLLFGLRRVLVLRRPSRSGFPSVMPPPGSPAAPPPPCRTRGPSLRRSGSSPPLPTPSRSSTLSITAASCSPDSRPWASPLSRCSPCWRPTGPSPTPASSPSSPSTSESCATPSSAGTWGSTRCRRWFWTSSWPSRRWFRGYSGRRPAASVSGCSSGGTTASSPSPSRLSCTASLLASSVRRRTYRSWQRRRIGSSESRVPVLGFASPRLLHHRRQAALIDFPRSFSVRLEQNPRTKNPLFFSGNPLVVAVMFNREFCKFFARVVLEFSHLSNFRGAVMWMKISPECRILISVAVDRIFLLEGIHGGFACSSWWFQQESPRSPWKGNRVTVGIRCLERRPIFSGSSSSCSSSPTAQTSLVPSLRVGRASRDQGS